MIHDQTQDHLARATRTRATAIACLGAQNLDMDRIEVGPLQRLEQRPGSRQQRLCTSLCLGHRLLANDHNHCSGAPTRLPGRRHLQSRGGRTAANTGHPHAVDADLFQMNLREIGHHIG